MNLSFKPSMDGREFSEVLLNGEPQEITDTAEFTYDTVKGADAESLDFSFTVVSKGVLNTLMDLAFAQKSNSSKSAAEQIKEIVDREYQKDLSVEEIAERIHFSPSYTRRVFKNKMGVTILDYLQSVRMEKARGYLLSPEYKVYEIGNLVGYENPSYFNLVFRKYYGVAPGAFREQYWGSKK